MALRLQEPLRFPYNCTIYAIRFSVQNGCGSDLLGTDADAATPPNLDSKLAGLSAVAHTHRSLISPHGAFGTLPGVQTTVRGASMKADPTVHLIGLSNFNGQTAPTPTGLHTAIRGTDFGPPTYYCPRGGPWRISHNCTISAIRFSVQNGCELDLLGTDAGAATPPNLV